MGKAEITSEFILQKVAPYFNQHGYDGTSLSDITALTGLTKGAIYGNFKNKENLAVEAFRYNVRNLINEISKRTMLCDKSYEKLFSITKFYESYMEYSEQLGGCPILQIGADNLHSNSLLKAKVKSITIKIKKSLEDIIRDGMSNCEMKAELDPIKLSNVIYGTIEGGIFMSTLLDDESILKDNIEYLNQLITESILRE